MMNRTCTITSQNGALQVRIPYDPAFVAALKANVPSAGRTWDPTHKTWVVASNYATALQMVVTQYYPGTCVPHAVVAAPRAETRLLDVRYVGQAKDRGDAERSAFGYAGDAWSVIFPESELQRWFGLDAGLHSTSESATLYQALNVAKTATPEEIKSGWRRLARQWHPDVCKEPDAAIRFRNIQEAYELLSNPGKRARYDAALIMTAATPQPRAARYCAADAFRPPLRCGYILAEGHEQLGRFLVSKILAWEDITQGGKTLVTSWPAGADTFQEAWT